MKRRDIVIGVSVLIFLTALGYWRVKTRQPQLDVSEDVAIEEMIEETFNLTIPDDVEKATLKDATGGDSSGITTRDYEDGKFSLTVLADLPDIEIGVYQAWLQKGEKGEENYSLISLGKMRVAKGGWILEFESSLNYSDFESVLVSSEETFDKNIETRILEGSF